VATHGKKACVLFFAKAPKRADVKTRLAAEVGKKAAVELYRCFVEDTFSLLQRLDIPVRVYFHPAEAEADFVQWLGGEYNFIPQAGENLGARIKNAFYDAFEAGFSICLALGADSPDVPAAYIELALAALESDRVVIGPASDGGYYLVGFTKESFVPESFENILWSTPLVFGQTIEILKKRGSNIYQLPRWYDIDTLADLNLLMLRNKHTYFRRSKTFRYVKANRLWSKVNV